MARTSVETRALGEQRFTDLQEDLGWDRARTIGVLVILWHDSQERGVSVAPKESIKKFIAVPRGERDQVFDALLANDYLSKTENDQFEIKGNRRHVEALQELSATRSAAGKASWESRKTRPSTRNSENGRFTSNEAKPEQSFGVCSGVPNTCSVNSSKPERYSMQCNPLLSITTQDDCIDGFSGGVSETPTPAVVPELLNGSDRSNQFFSTISKETQTVWLKKYGDAAWIKNQLSTALDWLSEQPDRQINHPGRWFSSWLKKARDKETAPATPFVLESPKSAQANTEANREVWSTYREAYFDRWKVEPTRNQVVNAQISNFVKRVGKDDARFVIAFYVGHNDSYYVKSQHPVSLALRDAEGLRTQWLRGRPVTQSDIRNFEKTEALTSQLERIDRGEV